MELKCFVSADEICEGTYVASVELIVIGTRISCVTARDVASMILHDMTYVLRGDRIKTQ